MSQKNIIDLTELIAELGRNRQSYVFFIGNSIPQIHGAKSWKEVCKNLIHVCNENGSLKNHEKMYLDKIINDKNKYSEIIMKCRKHLYERNAENVYKNIILKALKQDGQQYETYKKIIELEPKHIITTNVDKCLIPQNGYTVRPINEYELVPDHGIFYLHGSIDNFDEMVFPLDSYDRVYSDETHDRFLRSVFRNRILFIGYGFGEGDILHYCRFKPEKYRLMLRFIKLCGIPDDSDEQIFLRGETDTLWERFKIFTYEFPVFDNKWSKLIELLNTIHATITGKKIRDIGDEL